MEWIIAIVVVIVAVTLCRNVRRKQKIRNDAAMRNADNRVDYTRQNLRIDGAYQKKWLFSYHEKDAYWKLVEMCKKHDLYVMAKVRLLDLLEPVKGTVHYKSYFWKVQAKHVDFVLCDKKLVARCIVELDDSSHNQENRKERDAFVDEVLQSVGYEVIHLRDIELQSLEKQICTMLKI